MAMTLAVPSALVRKQSSAVSGLIDVSGEMDDDAQVLNGRYLSDRGCQVRSPRKIIRVKKLVYQCQIAASAGNEDFHSLL